MSPPVPYEIFRADHSCLVSVLPVNASVRDVLRALAPRLGQDREHVLVKVNSAGGEGAPPGWPCPRAQPGSVPSSIPAPRSLPADRAVLPPDAVGVFTALGLNERLFVVSRDELGSLVSAGWGSGVGSTGQTPQRGWGLQCLALGCPSLPGSAEGRRGQGSSPAHRPPTPSSWAPTPAPRTPWT